MKKFLGISLLGLVLLSCSKDQILEELGVVPYTITFEDVALESSGFMEYKYAEHGVGFEQASLMAAAIGWVDPDSAAAAYLTTSSVLYLSAASI